MDPVLTSTTTPVGEFLMEAWKAYGAGDWSMLAGIGIMLGLTLLGKLGLLAKFSKWQKRIAAAALALLTAIAAGLMQHMSGVDTLAKAIETAVWAVGSWEFFGKGLRDGLTWLLAKFKK